MASNSRATNQYYGKYCECAVVACLNNSPIEYSENYTFSEKEEKELFNQAQLIADYIGPHQATYLGNHTFNESGDLRLDNGDIVEIKRVSAGNGTYFNTSIYYFEKFGFNFKEYMEKYGLYDALEESFGTVNRKNNSPVNIPTSSNIRHNYKEIYENKIVPIDINLREHFTVDIANYFQQNPNNVYEFIMDMLNKNTVTCHKAAPDRLIVLNYRKNSVREIDLVNFTKNISANIRITPKGLVIGNIRVVFSWQNGVGLCNPTIRVFLEE